MVATDTLQELKVGRVGHHGLGYILSALERCKELRVLHAEVVDTPSLHKDMETLTSADFNYSDHAGPEDPEAAADDGDEQAEASKKKREDARMARLTEHDYDSDAEGGEQAEQSADAPKPDAPAPSAP